MIPLEPKEYHDAADLFADGFRQDPAFAYCLQNERQPNSLLYQYFFGYMKNCKDILLYKTSDQLEGILCLYHWDAEFPEEDFAPQALISLADFQILDRFYHRDFAALDIMAVHPDHRGQGLAGKMIDFFVAHCKEQGLIPLTEIFGESHLGLYQSRGFRITHQQSHLGITTYILEYPL